MLNRLLSYRVEVVYDNNGITLFLKDGTRTYQVGPKTNIIDAFAELELIHNEYPVLPQETQNYREGQFNFDVVRISDERVSITSSFISIKKPVTYDTLRQALIPISEALKNLFPPPSNDDLNLS